ncbi:MAG: hypothetical protein HON14_15190 [Rhodospirillaceae bacterium]|jgi:hypothetical protein|nr:hypothetical protein [Rhodospirillaceae bacterium]MBT4587866.1 hypothetical protein [Rhodospirillaceae bacterium]MBT4940478.1 hypothetical protein [Rhodospirillaceae bacterium]MBT7267399.1 hypothetical protein [Rhodospirillaceae bacterium]
MSEVLKAEWFDLAETAKSDMWAWLHEEYFPALRAAQGVAWVGHYDIVPQPDRPYIEGAPQKKETTDPAVPPGQQNVVLIAAASPEVFFGPNNPVDALEKAHAEKLSARENFRNAVYIEEQVINAPEQRTLPYGMGPPPAMQLGNYIANTPEDEIELARWYRSERFARVSVSRGMIRGRKMLSIAGWAKHGVLWEFTDLPEGEFTFEPRFIEADRGEEWPGRHVLEYVTHSPGGPHAGRRIWPAV